jgi:hypothetical protein
VECSGNKVAKKRYEVVMEWNAKIIKMQKQEKKLRWNGELAMTGMKLSSYERKNKKQEAKVGTQVHMLTDCENG